MWNSSAASTTPAPAVGPAHCALVKSSTRAPASAIPITSTCARFVGDAGDDARRLGAAGGVLSTGGTEGQERASRAQTFVAAQHVHPAAHGQDRSASDNEEAQEARRRETATDARKGTVITATTARRAVLDESRISGSLRAAGPQQKASSHDGGHHGCPEQDRGRHVEPGNAIVLGSHRSVRGVRWKAGRLRVGGERRRRGRGGQRAGPSQKPWSGPSPRRNWHL